MDPASGDDPLPSSEGLSEEIDLQDSGRTSLGLSTSTGPYDSVVLNRSEKSTSENDGIQDSVQYNSTESSSSTYNSTKPRNSVDLNESISIIEPPLNSVYTLDSNDPSIIDLSKDQQIVFGQYEDYGMMPAHVWKRRLDKQFKPLKEFKVCSKACIVFILDCFSSLFLLFYSHDYVNKKNKIIIHCFF